MGGEREGERLELELGVQTFHTILRLAEFFFFNRASLRRELWASGRVLAGECSAD